MLDIFTTISAITHILSTLVIVFMILEIKSLKDHHNRMMGIKDKHIDMLRGKASDDIEIIIDLRDRLGKAYEEINKMPERHAVTNAYVKRKRFYTLEDVKIPSFLNIEV